MKFFKYIGTLLLAIVFLQILSGFGLLKSQRITKQKVTTAIGCAIIDVSQEIITNADCNKSNGSITGIKVTSSGTKISYTWHDEASDVVGHDVDLTNVPSGLYSLTVSDNSGCGSVSQSPNIFISNKNAITISDSSLVIKSATCKNDGSITGLTAKNATTITWIDTTTKAVVSTSSSSADLIGVPAGSYQMIASNATCQATSKTYTVVSINPLPRVLGYNVQGVCGSSSTLNVNLLVPNTIPTSRVFLTDSAGLRIYNGYIIAGTLTPTLSIPKLDPGAYSLYYLSPSGCITILGSYVIVAPALVISKTSTYIRNDRCNQHLGYILTSYSGAATEPKYLKFTWTDSTGTVLSKYVDLLRIGAGTYTITIFDPIGGCTATANFTVINVSPTLAPPEAEGTTLCLPGEVNIKVTNPDTAEVFRLYAAPEDSIPIDSNTTGVFYKYVDKTTNYYVSRVHGACESDRTQVTETVVFNVKIPNAFTPNNDGINDVWNIPGIEDFPNADIRIFNRDGQLVYHSVNYAVPFDGTYKGSPLPVGVYYYVIDVKQSVCAGKVAGSLTIIR